MQSRYYNPEWGRFINSDGVIGQTGELLSHNMFAYCKNNPINMSDANGDRPEFSGTGHDSSAEIADSTAYMRSVARQSIKRYSGSSSAVEHTASLKSSKKSTDVSYDYVGAARDAVLTAAQNAKAFTAKIPYMNNLKVKFSLEDVGTFSEGFMGINIITTTMSINQNNQDYNLAEASAMNMVDLLCLVGGTALGAALVAAEVGLAPIIGAGIAVGLVGYGAKQLVDLAFKKLR